MTDYVFDTEPLIAYFYDEPGADDVRERLHAVEAEEATGALSPVTAAEIAYKIARLKTGKPNQISPSEDNLEVGERDVRILKGFGVTMTTPPWQLVARVKVPGDFAWRRVCCCARRCGGCNARRRCGP